MERHRTTLSFLTESKTSAAEFSSMRRVAMALLVMFLLTATGAWAQEDSHKIIIQVNNEDWGMVSAPTEAQKGTNVQFTVTPADDYIIIKNVSLSDSKINDLEESETGQYSFTMGETDVTITVEFVEKISYTITN
jgi:hypothetical protein